ncbi:hypothetical protein L916_12409, partial [Phytophthora nicotianae]
SLQHVVYASLSSQPSRFLPVGQSASPTAGGRGIHQERRAE